MNNTLFASFGGNPDADTIITTNTVFLGRDAAETWSRVTAAFKAAERTTVPVLLATPVSPVPRLGDVPNTRAGRSAKKKTKRYATRAARRHWKVALQRDGEDFTPALPGRLLSDG